MAFLAIFHRARTKNPKRTFNLRTYVVAEKVKRRSLYKTKKGKKWGDGKSSLIF